MRQAAVVLALLATACGGATPEEQAALNAREIATVEAASSLMPPRERLDPQPILFPDIQSAALYGPGCAFVPEGGGMGAIVMTQGQRAAIKLEDQLVVLASDPGSIAMPHGTWSHYVGKTHALTLFRVDGKADIAGWRGKLSITDPKGQVIYEATGLVQCTG